MKTHAVTKRRRRPKNSRRKDYTRETMLALRSPEQYAASFRRAMDIFDDQLKERQRITARRAEREKKRWA